MSAHSTTAVDGRGSMPPARAQLAGLHFCISAVSLGFYEMWKHSIYIESIEKVIAEHCSDL